MNKKCEILFFCMIFVGPDCFAQIAVTPKVQVSLIMQALKPATPFVLTGHMAQATTDNTFPILSSDYYAKQLGFFCKQEIKFDKLTKIPFRLRLGSIEQCNLLEGKKYQ
jgi:hypothetical protein